MPECFISTIFPWSIEDVLNAIFVDIKKHANVFIDIKNKGKFSNLYIFIFHKK
jgi:hypothetical protein